MIPRGEWPRDIPIGPFGVHHAYFWRLDFYLFKNPDAAFPISCMQSKGHPAADPKNVWYQGWMTLGFQFQLDHLGSTKRIFENWISTLLRSHMQRFPFRACRRVKGNCRLWTSSSECGLCCTIPRFSNINFHSSNKHHFPFPACSGQHVPHENWQLVRPPESEPRFPSSCCSLERGIQSIILSFMARGALC